MKIYMKQRFLKLLRWIPILFLCIGIENCSFFHRSVHDDVFSDEGVLIAQSDELKATAISPHLEIALRPGSNVLWCGAFQLAWNEAYTLVGEELRFVDEHPMVAVLNTRVFTREALDDVSFVALAGFMRDNIHQRIHDALRQKFGGQASPHSIPSSDLTPRPQDIVAYSYLFKNLAFAIPFERLKKSLRFKGTHVACFGIGEEYKPGQRNMYPQVSILDYRHPDDFVIELATRSKGDRVILAKMMPEATLGDTISVIQQRIAKTTPVQAEPGDVLKVPKFNFDITRRYAELERRPLIVKNPDIAKDLMILSAVQNIRFQMDEEGVKLRSESHLAIGCAAHYEPRPRYMMIFDKPFLILLKRVDATVPYLALWVDNPELLLRK